MNAVVTLFGESALQLMFGFIHQYSFLVNCFVFVCLFLLLVEKLFKIKLSN